MSKFKINFMMLAIAALTMLAPQAHALNTVGTTVCSVYGCIVNNELLAVIATVAIFFLGIGAFFGKVNWGLVIIIALGVVIIVGAMGIATTLVGGNDCETADTLSC